MTDETDVTQADRDRAAGLLSDGFASLTWVEAVRAGQRDEQYVVQAFALHRLAAEQSKQDEIAQLKEALVMAVAEMMRASGRIEIIATCNEDRRIAAALQGTCDFARNALLKGQPDATE